MIVGTNLTEEEYAWRNAADVKGVQTIAEWSAKGECPSDFSRTPHPRILARADVLFQIPDPDAIPLSLLRY
jgi:hypothetical protein